MGRGGDDEARANEPASKRLERGRGDQPIGRGCLPACLPGLGWFVVCLWSVSRVECGVGWPWKAPASRRAAVERVGKSRMDGYNWEKVRKRQISRLIKGGDYSYAESLTSKKTHADAFHLSCVRLTSFRPKKLAKERQEKAAK